MLLSTLALAVAGAVLPLHSPRDPVADSTPRLVVLLVVDQLRPDHLLRYRREWSGGFDRILRQGAVFTRGQQDHAVTQTAPGHATLLSGRFPAHTGIVTNDNGVIDPLTSLIGDSGGAGASPRRFRGTTLADWLIAGDSATRVLSLAMKNRSAILPVGRSRASVYWWSTLGFFTTSRYYRDTLPEWVVRWNRRTPLAGLLGRQWDLSRPDAAYPERDSLPAERGVDGRVTFPHQLSGDAAKAGGQLPHFPWMDSLTLDLALAGVAARGLGTGPAGRVDLLSVSLSSVDEIGHDFGPDSRELHDMLLRLDGYLGWFLDSLAAVVPPERTLFVLTSDHGTQAMPEQVPPGGTLTPGRAWPTPLAKAVAADLSARWRTDFGIRFDYGVVTADVAALRARGLDVDSLAQSLAARFAAEPSIERAFTPRSLAAAPPDDPLAERWRHSLPADFGWLVAVVPREGTTWDSWVTGANHGTPWALDVEVPIVFWGGGVQPRSVARPVRTVDIAPTLARLLGVAPTERLDGSDLPEVRRRSP